MVHVVLPVHSGSDSTHGAAYVAAQGPYGTVTVTKGVGPVSPLAAWALDDSGRGRIGPSGSVAHLDVNPDFAATVIPTDPATGVPVEEPIVAVSYDFDAPVIDPDTGAVSGGTDEAGIPRAWTAVPAAGNGQVFGVHRVVVDGVDRTFFRGAPLVPTWETQEPFGSGPATLTVPTVTPLEAIGSGALAWLKTGALVRIHQWNTTAGGSELWTGILVTEGAGHDETSSTVTFDLIGCLWAGAGLQMMTPPAQLLPTDIGARIAAALNSVVSRRVAAMPAVSTGIKTRDRGSWDQKLLDHVQGLLATAGETDGDQWTVAEDKPRQPTLRLKNRTTAHWSIRTGQPGLQVDLKRDATEAENVIWGRGTNSDGYTWANWQYPNADNVDPGYPFSSAGSVMTIGTSDDDTSTGSGVTDWQRRVNELGVTDDIAEDGVYNATDATAARAIQRHFGISVDGVVGPQTWAATWDIGANGSALDSFRLPLAWTPAVMPRRYVADGGDAGPNPSYNAAVLRVEKEVNYGAGVTKEQARRSAQLEIARGYPAGYVGTLTLRVDPREGSRWAIRAGQNIKLLGYRGADVLLHIARAHHDPVQATVTLTVDSKARDLITIGAIIERDLASKPDPARRPGDNNRQSKIPRDAIVEFDGESPGGRIPRVALFAGLWTVLRIPVAQVGRIAKVEFTTKSPKSRFGVALFGAPVTANRCADLIGNPIPGGDATGSSKYADEIEELRDKHALIEAWGGPGAAGGFWPRQESDDSAVLTGKLHDTGTLEYTSAKPPWIWVALYAEDSCYLSGRLFPAPNDL